LLTFFQGLVSRFPRTIHPSSFILLPSSFLPPSLPVRESGTKSPAPSILHPSAFILSPIRSHPRVRSPKSPRNQFADFPQSSGPRSVFQNLLIPDTNNPQPHFFQNFIALGILFNLPVMDTPSSSITNPAL
jgi:hypothetical protein